MKSQVIRLFEDTNGEGFVDVHADHNGSEKTLNIQTATLLAQHGYQVLLLPIVDGPGIKNPDAFLIREKRLIEFKHNQTPTASAIDNEVRDAQKQSDLVLLHILSEIKPGALLNGLKDRIRRSEKVKALWLIWKDELIQVTREEVLSGVLDAKIQ
ncbi:MAG: hypothetical protein EAZ91_02385 [Cytophagales bacterium]|nr:MAG: hypothetical protein EAZ91_02385 [Cytophagales bacterium]